MTNILQQQLLYCFVWSSNQLLFRLFYLSTQFLSVFNFSLIEFPASIDWLIGLTHWLSELILAWRTIFKERVFSVSKKWVRSWSHAFLMVYQKTLTKKLLAVLLKRVTRRKKQQTNKKTKNRKANSKDFCVKGKQNEKSLTT